MFFRLKGKSMGILRDDIGNCFIEWKCVSITV